MKKDELPSLQKLKSDANGMKLLSSIFAPQKIAEINEIQHKVNAMEKQLQLFTERFSDNGWCIYGKMKHSIIEEANQAFKKDGIEAAEQVLLLYFKGEIKDVTYWVKNSDPAFMCRYDLLEHCFKEHFEGHYYASIPLALIIIDGAVNDFTRSKGFFADGTDTDAWDCIVGCSDALSKVKDIFGRNRTKTNHEPIYMPYRHGILHGRDTNFDNEYVACKVIALLFAVADWMVMKKSEGKRKEKFEQENNPPSMRELFTKTQQTRIDKEQIAQWKRRELHVGSDVPEFGKPEDYSDYPYIMPIIKMLEAWRAKNYGELSKYLEKLFPEDETAGRRAGSCRTLFDTKQLEDNKLVSVKEEGCCLSQVEIYVSWYQDSKHYGGILRFGCLYQNHEKFALPWRNNGTWTLIPRDIRKLYNPDKVTKE